MRRRQPVQKLWKNLAEQVRPRGRKQSRTTGDVSLLILDRHVDGVGAIELIAFPCLENSLVFDTPTSNFTMRCANTARGISRRRTVTWLGSSSQWGNTL